MRRCFWIFFLLSGFISQILSQNLVPNASFEEHKKCPKNYTVHSRRWLIPGWYMPTRGTADYFHMCTLRQVGVPKNFMGNCFPREGMAYAGLILMENPSENPNKFFNYREYLQAELLSPLEKGKKYTVCLHFALASYSTYAINRIGIHFSKERIKKRRNTKILNVKPQVMTDTLTLTTERDEWTEIRDTITANGGEKFLTIGNFYDDPNTCYQALNLNGLGNYLERKIKDNRLAYYYFDLISVEVIP
jgi:hypothetical protein